MWLGWLLVCLVWFGLLVFFSSSGCGCLVNMCVVGVVCVCCCGSSCVSWWVC